LQQTNQSASAQICQLEGKFQDALDPTCTKYYTCSKNSNGSLSQLYHQCLNGSFYSPGDGTCTSSYVCSSTVDSFTKKSTFICNDIGKYDDPNDSCCKNYFLCTLMPDGTFIQTPYSCPDGQKFDPAEGDCKEDSSCFCNSSLDDFECSAVGRFNDLNDPLCTNYFLCTQMPNGSYIQTIYSCENSYFDPSLGTCREDYTCSTFECTDVGRYSDPQDSTCLRYYLCTALPNGRFIKTEYSCSDGRTFDPKLEECSSLYKCPTNKNSATTLSADCITQKDNFECTDIGRFKKPDDATCTKYYLCSVTPSGSFLKTEYVCPNGTHFDHANRICSSNYQCSCTNEVTHSPVTTTTKYPTCTVAEDKFKCFKEGRFVNNKDVTCARYFLCSLLTNGSYVQTEYSCPLGSLFDPELHLCSTLYQCPCSTTTRVTTTRSSSTVPTTTTINCNTTQENIPEFVCSEKGRFVNLKDKTCTTYFLCSLLHNNSFIQTGYSCPLGSFFDPKLHICSVLYNCPCTSLSSTVETTTKALTTSTASPTRSLSTTTSPCYAFWNTSREFICTEKGRFFNPKDATCWTYLLCSLLRNGSFIQTEYSCPLGSFFDPDLHLCSVSYRCPCSLTTTTYSSTAQFSTTQSSNKNNSTTAITSTTSTTSNCFAAQNGTEEFVCSEKGRFFNLRDLTCTTYFLCSLLRNGSFIRTEYSCPLGSRFDPELHLCSVLYECPCSGTTTTDWQSTISSHSSTESITTTSLTTSTSTICFANQNHTENFICSEKGRFFNPKDITCTTYFLCSLLRNGTFIQTEYPCPAGSYFDPELQLCSILYQCPCPTTNSTSTSLTTPDSSISTTSRTETTETSLSTPTETSTKTTTSVCIATQNNTEIFICSEKGRFVNPKDVTCTTYFLCSLLRNGSFIQTAYSCPAGSFFDPELQLCSTLYNCPCISSQTTESTLTAEPSHSTTSLTESSTSKSSLSTIYSTTTTSDCLATQNYTEDFICSEKGRFFNPRDSTCTTYFLCSLLRNGSFIQTEYPCPLGSFFDPELQLCSILYQCPCTSNQSTTPLSSTTKSSTTEISSSTTILTSTTTSDCLATQNYTEEFICSEKGRFFNPRDPTCTTYFLCSLLRNGSFIQTEYPCPAGSFFDPELHLCNILYQCPCQSTQSTQSTSITPETTVGPSSSTTSLTKTTETTTSQIPSSTTIISSTTTTSVCLATQDNVQDFVCSEKGRFVNPRDVTCTTYFLCSLLRNGSFIQTEYPCPVGSFFDPKLQLCNILYQCPCTSNQSTTPLSSTTKSSSTKISSSTTILTSTTSDCLASQNYTEEFICSEKGRFFNPRDPTCSTYFLCSLLRNGSFIQTEYPCPAGSFFDPELHLCNIFYQCPCQSTQSTESTSLTPDSSVRSSISTSLTKTTKTSTSQMPLSTTSPSTTTTSICLATQDNLEDFACSEKGRFVNPRDATCATYFLCSLLRNGSFIQTEYSCPVGSFFDPELQLCSILYQCPCTTNQSTTLSTTTKSSETTEISSSMTILTSTTTSDCLATQNYTEEFICAEKGRFFNPRDVTCTTYFLCSLLRNGSFIQTEYPCPVGSFFDPELHLCNILYQCPCQSTQSTESTLLTTETTVEPSSSTTFLTKTTETSTTQMPSSTTTISSTTTTSVCLATQENLEDFACSEKGRFVNSKDATCTTYFLCSLLRNGSFIQTEYPCPLGSFFDPELQLCSILYQCPCTTNQSTTSLSTTTKGSTTDVSLSTTILTSTTSDCLATQNYTEEFICSEKGRFFNPRDETCTTYFLCSLLRNGSFIQTEYSCPAGSFFDPELHLCNILYKCPCQSTQSTESTSLTTSLTKTTKTSTSQMPLSTTSSSTTTTSICLATQDNLEDFACSEKGRFVNPRDVTCATYFLCSLLRNGSFIQTEYSCPVGSFFDPELQLCSILYQCPCTTNQSTTLSTTTTSSEITDISSSTTILISTTTSDCLATKNSTEEFLCSEKGRFFNPKDPTCMTYYLCSLLRNGSFIQTEYSCPEGSFFDPDLQLCSILYQCPCLRTTTDITATRSTTLDPCVPPKINGFTCSEKGRFLHQLDVSCSSYYLCNLLRNGSFVQTKYVCPSGSYFDPSIQICNVNYECPCSLLE
jgi:hypothetical protein